jgi:predicted DNA-binding transcriptional regulator YafY
MRRADRLFQIVGVLRRRRLVTAQLLAEQLEVSERTIYRDIADLIASGVPIAGEAGVGYRLDPSYRLPPLLFTPEEVEALVLGMRMVESWADEDLRRSARSVLDKIDAVVPPRERSHLDRTALFSLSFPTQRQSLASFGPLRRAINGQQKVTFLYEDKSGALSRRTVRPLGLYFWGGTWTLGAWCELREDFRNFRVDRVTELTTSSETFELEPPCTLEAYVASMEAEDGGAASDECRLTPVRARGG